MVVAADPSAHVSLPVRTSRRCSMARTLAPDSVAADYAARTQSFRRSMMAENKSPKTIKTYGEAMRLVGAFLDRNGMPQTVSHIKREHVEAFIADLRARCKPATASNRYRALQQFLKWCVSEGEIK